jgi:hypothetical protein
MRQVLNKSMIVMAAASGILTAVGGNAHAGASADGVAENSGGVASGNTVQVPVHVPVNVCGNTVNVIAVLNPAFGNACANVDSDGGASGASAEGKASDSPGVLSGNVVQAPVEVPVNVCGNTVNAAGALNPAADNDCANVSGAVVEETPAYEAENPPADTPSVDQPSVDQPPADEPSPQEPPAYEPPAAAPAPNTPGTQLAETGAGELGLAAGASAALLLGGAVLMRRTRGSRK